MSLHILGATSWLPAPTLDDVRKGELVVGKGMKGDAVTYVQALVNVHVDGEFGAATETAVKAFQTAHGLEPTGVVTKSVMLALDTLAGGTAGIAPVQQQFAADVQTSSSSPASKGKQKDRAYATTIVDPVSTQKRALSLALPLLGGLALGGGMVGVIWDAHRLLGALLGSVVGAGAGYALYATTTKKDKVQA